MYDAAKAQYVVDFINCLKHIKGRWKGQNFDLLLWQDKIIRDIFGNIKPNVYRQYNTAYVEIPKKNGKSELVAAVALYMTCGDNEWGAVQMVQNLDGMGFTVVPFGQGYKDMSPPSKELMKLTLEERITHGGNPVLRWIIYL